MCGGGWVEVSHSSFFIPRKFKSILLCIDFEMKNVRVPG